MEAMKKSDDDSFLQYPNEIIKTPALRKSRYIGSFQQGKGAQAVENQCEEQDKET